MPREAFAEELGGPERVKRQHDGDRLTIRFDRPTNVSELALGNNPAAIGFDTCFTSNTPSLASGNAATIL